MEAGHRIGQLGTESPSRDMWNCFRESKRRQDPFPKARIENPIQLVLGENHHLWESSLRFFGTQMMDTASAMREQCSRWAFAVRLCPFLMYWPSSRTMQANLQPRQPRSLDQSFRKCVVWCEVKFRSFNLPTSQTTSLPFLWWYCQQWIAMMNWFDGIVHPRIPATQRLSTASPDPFGQLGRW